MYPFSAPNYRITVNTVVSKRSDLWDRGKSIFLYPRSRLRIWSRETGSEVPSRVSLLISILRLNLVLIYGTPLEFRDTTFMYLFKTAIRHRASPVFIVSRNCVPMAFTAEIPPAQGQ